LDDSAFDGNAALDAPALRRAVLSRAVRAREQLAIGARFERAGVLAEVAAELGMSAEALESGLYSDLRSAERLLKAPAYDAEGLLFRHARAEVQAVLLCSVRVVVDVRCASPDQYRALFHKLKFRQLLFQMSRRDGEGYRIEIDGPYSLFESVTKYGLELALLLPALEACEQVQLAADLRWGKKREKLSFARCRCGTTCKRCSKRFGRATRGVPSQHRMSWICPGSVCAYRTCASRIKPPVNRSCVRFWGSGIVPRCGVGSSSWNKGWPRRSCSWSARVYE
jgi:predicted nuclease of restriction endonuclease-like RecB superfamily